MISKVASNLLRRSFAATRSFSSCRSRSNFGSGVAHFRLGKANLPAAVASGIQCFSSSSFHPATSKSLELASVLAEELKYEKSVAEEEIKSTSPGGPQFLQDFKAKNLFQIHEKPGVNEIELTREFADEKIQVFYSVDDIAAMGEQPAEEEVEENAAPESFPVSVVINISKPLKPELGVLTFQSVVEYNAFHIDSISFMDDVKLAMEETADADYKRRGFFSGPVFNDLDDNVIAKFYEYLQERGIDTVLAEFIPKHIEFREQEEYSRWLEKVGKFTQS